MIKKYAIIAIVAVIVLFAASRFDPTVESDSNTNTLGTADTSSMNQKLVIKDLVVGTGAEAARDKEASVHYRGTLINGTQFDSSYDRGTPFKFVLGAGTVIPGWEQGLLGMKVGGKRMLTIPPELAYGERGQGSVPPNSTLIFEVELLGVK